jgi:hypothetical protein
LAIQKDVEWVRRERKEQNTPWLFLCDGKLWEGDLARTLGGPYYARLFLIDREGRLRKINDPEVIDAEMVGLTYKTARVWLGKLAQETRSGTFTVEQLKAQLGEPDERVDSPHGPDYEQWIYIRLDENREREKRLQLHFDRQTRIVSGLGSRHRILEPAKLTVAITPEYWRDGILPRIDPKYWPENDREDKYVVLLAARRLEAPMTRYYFGDHTKDYEPGKAVSRDVLHGKYEISIEVQQREPYRSLHSIHTKSDHVLALEKNSKTEITLE